MPQIYTTNQSMTPKYKYEWRISETNYVLTVSAICGVKTKHSRLDRIKPIETECVTSYRSL
jgi:hypothetical protein